MSVRRADQRLYEQADWKKIVLALADYAYRAMAPDTTWDEARVLVRTAIYLTLSPEEESWDPREESLMRHLGGTLREVVLAARRERGDGQLAREESPDWEIAKGTYAIAEMRRHLPGEVGLPMSIDDYFRARRRLRIGTIEICRELRANKE